MEISGAETASSRELTINEKLLQFRKKKDESRKENDIPQNKNSAPTKVQTYTSKVSSNKSNLSKPLEVRSNASKVFKFTCLPVVAQTIPVSTLRPQKEPIASTSKLVEMQVESRGRVLRTKSRIPTASEFKIKLEEYVMLAENAGIVVARSFISTVPSEVNMKDVEMQALYWLTWIRHEREAEQWEFVSSLFLRAKNTVKSLSGVQAILTAEQNFLEKFVPIQPSNHDNLIEAFEDKIW